MAITRYTHLAVIIKASLSILANSSRPQHPGKRWHSPHWERERNQGQEIKWWILLLLSIFKVQCEDLNLEASRRDLWARGEAFFFSEWLAPLMCRLVWWTLGFLLICHISNPAFPENAPPWTTVSGGHTRLHKSVQSLFLCKKAFNRKHTKPMGEEAELCLLP